MTKKEARDYLRRWQLVEETRLAELQQTPIEEKFRQMDACYRMAVALNLMPKLTVVKRRSEKEAASRWRRLKQITA